MIDSLEEMQPNGMATVLSSSFTSSWTWITDDHRLKINKQKVKISIKVSDLGLGTAIMTEHPWPRLQCPWVGKGHGDSLREQHLQYGTWATTYIVGLIDCDWLAPWPGWCSHHQSLCAEGAREEARREQTHPKAGYWLLTLPQNSVFCFRSTVGYGFLFRSTVFQVGWLASHAYIFSSMGPLNWQAQGPEF